MTLSGPPPGTGQTPILSLSGYTATDGSVFVDSISTRTVSSVSFVTLCAPSGPLGEADDVLRLELLLAVRAPERRPTLQDDEPLLVRVLVVIGADALPRRELVQGHAQPLRLDRRPEAGHSGTVTLGVGVVVGDLELREVRLPHCPDGKERGCAAGSASSRRPARRSPSRSSSPCSGSERSTERSRTGRHSCSGSSRARPSSSRSRRRAI